MDFESALNRFKDNIEKTVAINYAGAIMEWDASTGAPAKGAPMRGHSLGFLTLLTHEVLINDQAKNDLDTLYANMSKLTETEERMVIKARKEFDRMSKIPKNELRDYQVLVNRSRHSWEEAREKDDFTIFSSDLKEIIETKKRFAKYIDSKQHPYNTLLDEYEEGMTIEKLETFFSALKKRIVPLLKKIEESGTNIRKDFLNREYNLDTQRKVAIDLLETLGFDLSRGLLKESTHPFTMGTNIDDVRLTSRYDKTNMVSGFLSVAHEGGHALYEQNISRDLYKTPLATGTSLGIHESQSRIYENNICKSREFISLYFPKLQEYYPNQLSDVTAEEFYKAVNIVNPSFIRVDADELTYSLHIMVRFETEIALIDGSLDVEDLPEYWNKKMEEYLGIIPQNNRLGVLQDVHWSHGLFGYFPTYALGSAYAAQFAYYMGKELDLSKEITNGNLDKPLKWLNSNIHTFGSLLTPDEISKKSCGELLNPDYFCKYLEDKFEDIYLNN